MMVAVLAALPMLVVFSMLTIDLADGFSITIAQEAGGEGRSTIEMLYHVTGELCAVGPCLFTLSVVEGKVEGFGDAQP